MTTSFIHSVDRFCKYRTYAAACDVDVIDVIHLLGEPALGDFIAIPSNATFFFAFTVQLEPVVYPCTVFDHEPIH